MTSSNTVERSASRLDLIGIAEDFTFVADPAALLRELLVTAALTLRNPAGIAAANTRFLRGYAAAVRAAAERAVGFETPGPIEVASGDRRFSDPAYRENPAYFLLAQQYLLFSQLVAELVDTAGVSGSREAKARFAAYGKSTYPDATFTLRLSYGKVAGYETGTTLAAAELTERACLGIELDPKYVDVIVQRWEQFTGRKAERRRP